ncbi:MAG: MFS transporter, partial [Methylotenera sp.]
MPIDKSRKTAVTFALGAAQMLSWGSTYYLPAVLAVQMADSVGIATDMVYAVFSGAMLLSAFLGPAAGRRIDRIGGRSVLAISSIIFAVGLVLIGSAENVGLFVLGWLVIGLGMGIGLYEAAFSTLAVIYGKESKNAIMAITLIAGFASTVCWPITTIVSAEWGWRLTCYFWALVNLGLVLPLYLFMIPTSRSVPEAVATDEREPAVNLYS